LLLAPLLGLLLIVPPALAHDIPNQILLHSFVKPEGGRLHFLVRIPLIMLASIGLPKRGPGYLDLPRIDDGLEKAAATTAKEIHLFENGTRLTPARARTHISQPSDRSFESYAEALAHIEGPKLPEETNVFWNQGYFDAHLEYPIRSERSDFSLDMRLVPGLSGRLKMIVRYMPPGGSTRAYQVHGGFGRLALDPRWHQAAWVFVKSGFFHILDGIDHLLFLFCLVIPFRRQWWDLVKVVTSFTVAHSITLIASAQGLVPAGDWFPPLVEMLIAVSILYMALENVVAANLRRRWLIAGAFGLVHGFGFSFALKQDLQFAGSHLLLSLLSFNVGVELGQILVLLVVLPALGLLFRHPVVTRFGVVILSILVGHTAWHWMLERVETLRRVSWPTLDADFVVMVARGVLVLLLVGAGAWFIVRKLMHRFASQKPRTKDDLTIEDGLT
jgi:hypothetical protein